MVAKLKEAGLQLYRTEEDLSGYTDKLAGQSIVISGVFVHHSRDEYKELIEKNGGKNVGSISAKTSFILAGDNMGPAKLEKAKKLGKTSYRMLTGEKNVTVVDYTQEEEVSLNGSNMLVGMEQEVGLILSAIHMGV